MLIPKAILWQKNDVVRDVIIKIEKDKAIKYLISLSVAIALFFVEIRLIWFVTELDKLVL